VIVLSIDDDSAFLRSGIRPGDVIESINQQPVNSPEEAIARLKRTLTTEQKNVLMLINRHGTNRYLATSLENKPNGRDDGDPDNPHAVQGVLIWLNFSSTPPPNNARI
jgi:S1-C subfamily serine protease